MIIGVCGFGWTGSGAVLDLLKEYKDIQVNDDFEFALTYWPDSIEDLELHLMQCPSRFFSSDTVLRRFKSYVDKESRAPHGWYKKATRGKFKTISKTYLEKITEVTWSGRSMLDPFLCGEISRTFKYRLLAKLFSVLPHSDFLLDSLLNRRMRFSIQPACFYEETEIYLENILKAMGNDLNYPIVLNQPFPANNPERSMRFYKDSKAIIVDRDPRDVFILSRKLKVKSVPTANVNSFIKYQMSLRRNVKEGKNILHVQFEDLIYRYEETKSKIELLCGIQANKHERPKTFFDPSISIRNTQLFKDNCQYAEEIEEIGNCLSDYLYPFPDVSIDRRGGIF